MRNSNGDNVASSNSGKELKKWETPVLHQEDFRATQGGGPIGPVENQFYNS